MDLGWLASEPQGSTRLCFNSVHHHAWLSYVFRGLNSGLGVYGASTLLSELRPHPLAMLTNGLGTPGVRVYSVPLCPACHQIL